MLDIIYENRTCDLGNMLNIGDVITGISSLINDKHSDSFASYIEGRLKTINTALDKLNEMYAD